LVPVRDGDKGATFAVRVQPRASRNAVAGEMGDALKIALTAPPVGGKANDACVEFLANLLKVPRSSVTITSGESSRNKVIRIAGMRASEVEQRLRAVIG
jgi:uncharacterized protein (TIGR00251 family)